MKLHPVRIKITNFQSIDELEIDVHGFTCITGPSNIGKSAVIRATSSAILNNPVVGMVRKGAPFCTVEASSEGWAFKWEKNDKGVNRVFIPPSNPKPLDKLGQTQVAAITEMGFNSIEVGDDQIQPWFAPQFQSKGCGPLFLLDQSGPRVTDFLSEVSRLTVLQDAVVLAARGKRAATDQAKAKVEEAAQVKTKLAKIGAIDSLEKLGVDLEEQAASIEEYERKIVFVEGLIAGRQEAERIIGTLEKIDDLRIPKDQCSELVRKVQGAYSFCFQLESAATRIRELRDIAKVKVPDTKKLRNEVDKVNAVAKLAVQIQTLQASVALLNKKVPIPDELDGVAELQQLSALAKQTKTISDEIASLETESREIERNLVEVNNAIAAIPVCPTCERPVGPSHTSQHQRISA